MHANLSNRAIRAIEVLKAGGYFRNQLERGFRGREQFRMRLRTASGSVVNGIGFATQNELKEAGMLTTRSCPSSSVWPTEYVLRNT